VVDGNQGQVSDNYSSLHPKENRFFQLIQVANDGQKPVTFQNQAGQILQATPITVVAPPNQPSMPSFQTTGDSSICKYLLPHFV